MINPIAKKLWRIVIIVLIIGIALPGLPALYVFFSPPTEGGGLGILPLLWIGFILIIVSITLGYLALYFTLKTKIDVQVLGFKKWFYLVLGLTCYLLIIWSLIWAVANIYTAIRKPIIANECAKNTKEYWLSMEGTSGIANDCIELLYHPNSQH